MQRDDVEVIEARANNLTTKYSIEEDKFYNDWLQNVLGVNATSRPIYDPSTGAPTKCPPCRKKNC